MGAVFSCVCSGANEKDINQYLNSFENKESKSERVGNGLEELVDIENNRKIVVIENKDFEEFIKSTKNYIVPSKNLIKLTEVTDN